MTGKRKPTAPSGLQAGGKRLWSQVTGAYDLRPDEVRVLEDAAFTTDLVDGMVAELRRAPLTVVGSREQKVVHPLVVEVRQQRVALASMLKQLRLPEEPGEMRTEAGQQSRSTQARAAANTRWSRRGTGIGG